MSTSHRDYIPQNAAQFNVFASRLIEYTRDKKTSDEWDNIPMERLETLGLKFAAFVRAFEHSNENRTHASVLARQEAQAEAVKELRGFVNQYLRFAPVTNVDRAEMGIPNHDSIRTDHTVVTETVDFVIHLRNIRELMVDFWIQGANHKAKPQGYDGAVIIWGILDAPPKHTDELTHHTMASRTPFALHFDETDRGKTCYIAVTWQNERGIRGQWSDYKSAVIP